MDWRIFKIVLAALILYGLVEKNQLATIGGVVMMIVVIAFIVPKRKPLPPRIYPEGKEPDADEWR